MFICVDYSELLSSSKYEIGNVEFIQITSFCYKIQIRFNIDKTENEVYRKAFIFTHGINQEKNWILAKID